MPPVGGGVALDLGGNSGPGGVAKNGTGPPAAAVVVALG